MKRIILFSLLMASFTAFCQTHRVKSTAYIISQNGENIYQEIGSYQVQGEKQIAEIIITDRDRKEKEIITHIGKDEQEHLTYKWNKSQNAWQEFAKTYHLKNKDKKRFEHFYLNENNIWQGAASEDYQKGGKFHFDTYKFVDNGWILSEKSWNKKDKQGRIIKQVGQSYEPENKKWRFSYKTIAKYDKNGNKTEINERYNETTKKLEDENKVIAQKIGDKTIETYYYPTQNGWKADSKIETWQENTQKFYVSYRYDKENQDFIANMKQIIFTDDKGRDIKQEFYDYNAEKGAFELQESTEFRYNQHGKLIQKDETRWEFDLLEPTESHSYGIDTPVHHRQISTYNAHNDIESIQYFTKKGTEDFTEIGRVTYHYHPTLKRENVAFSVVLSRDIHFPPSTYAITQVEEIQAKNQNQEGQRRFFEVKYE